MKKAITLIVLLSFALLSSAQPTLEWANAAGDIGEDYGQAITVDATGNTYITGYYVGTVDFDPGPGTASLTSVGNFDAYIVKYDPDGAVVWVRSVGGLNQDRGQGIVVDASGNVYVVGYFTLSGDFDPGAGTVTLSGINNNVFILKLDNNGDYIAAYTFDDHGAGNEFGMSIDVDATGNIYTSGQFEGTVDFDPGVGVVDSTSNGIIDIFVHKMDASGNLVWVKTMGGTGQDWARSVKVDNSGNVYHTGQFNGTVDLDPGPGTDNYSASGTYDPYIQKLDATGILVWNAHLSGNGANDWGSGIVVDDFQNVYSTGQFSGTMDFDPGAGTNNLTTPGGAHVYVLKLTASGGLDWVSQIGGNVNTLSRNIAIDPSGEVTFAAQFTGTVDVDPSVAIDNITSAGGLDILVERLNASGNYVWHRQMGGTNHDDVNGIAILSTNRVYATGGFLGTTNLDPDGTDNHISVGNVDIYTLKLSSCSNTSSTLTTTACDSLVSPSGNYTWTVSGSFMDTIPNAAGCDSVITVNLTINNATSATINPVACDSLVSPSGNYTWTVSGTYMDTIPNAVGCDSVITVNLTINNATSVTISPTACDSFVSPSTNYTWTVSGTYMDTIPNAVGCDSVITVNLTINNSTTATINPVACDSLVSPSGNYTWTVSGTYMDTIPNAVGCDSVITVNLTINNATSATINPVACDSLVSPSGNYTWTVSGTYMDTIPNAVGCDSVITVNLTINNATSATINPVACDSLVSPSGNYTWTVSGTYMDTIPNAAGCDSVITVNLTINNTTSATISPTACDSFVSPSTNYTWTVSGTYMDTIPNAVGCDSVITVNLTINNSTTATINPVACDSLVSPSGNYTWTVSGSYMDTIPNAVGCDSVITVNLTINNATSATINPVACDSLVSPSGNYTWTVSGTYMDTIPNAAGCDSVITVNLTINNATSATINPVACDSLVSPSGNYTWTVSGTYMDTIPNAVGCDSVITVNLTINNATTATISPTACDSFVSPSTNFTWTVSGTYMDTIPNAVGCDSVITVNLTINNATSATINPVACDSLVSPSGNYTWMVSGTYMDTIPNAVGCDSVITVNLTINNATTATISPTACDSYVSPSGNFTWTVSGTYMDTILNSAGCDSVITVNLTINNSSSATINPTACDSYVSPSTNYTWTTSGTYMDTITNAAGCDSVITVNLTINNSTTATISPTACDSYVSPSTNFTWTVSGTYMDTIPNAVGCDSVITVNLTINNSSSATINPIACDSLVSPSGNYTWTVSGTYMDTIPNAVGCDSVITVNLTINNATSATISPTACDSFVSPSTNYTWTVSGTYMDTIPNAVGCDSVITVNLTINNTTTATISPTACDSYVSPSTNFTWTVSGTYMDTITNAVGCDSVITVNLTINNATSATISPTACDSFVSPSTNYTWTVSGTYMDTIPNAVGCDSVITVNLTINNATSATINPIACDSLVSPSGNYTWTVSGTYMDTIPNAVGCDSVITVNLTINNSTTATISPTACDSYVSPSTNYTWTTSGTYMDTITNALGCDSVITVNLTINNATSATISPTACDSFVSPSTNYTWTVSGTYMDTIPNAVGCDSVITVNLTINNTTTATINPVACDSLVSPSGNYTWTVSGTYMDTIPNAVGCDSVITVNLTINNSTTATISPTACDSYVSPSTNYTWTTSGTYMDTITNALGCDSVITVNLTINNATSATISPTACDSFVSPSTNYTWTVSGTYMDTIPNAVGCDSVITVNLTINNTTTATISPTACDSYVSPSTNFTWTVSGTYMDTIPNAVGCDSVITVNLTINNATSATISPTACDSFVSPSTNYTWTVSGTYMDTIPNAVGCDSVITVNLTINNTTTATISPTACDSYVSPSTNFTWTVSGTYMDTITNALGCDSVITVNLTINNSSSATISPVACDSLVSPSGNYTWMVSGTYMDTIPNAVGCDSVITVNLTINNSTTATITPTACDSYVSPSGNYTWTTSGSYLDTITNAVGCDSVITVNLTINNSTTATISPTACDSYVSPSTNFTWTTSGTYMDTITNAAGCDSVITVNLTINNSTTATISPTACDSYVSPSTNFTWTVSGTYMDTIPNAVGCDSVITVNLTINNSSSATINPIACDSLVSPSGNYTWTVSGTYMDTIPNAVGCDSVITVNLTINNTTTATISPTACDSYVSPSTNFTWTVSGTYMDTIPNAVGCDSVITVNLTINNTTTATISPTACDSYVSPSTNFTWTVSGTYMDTIPNAVGCDSVITVNLTINNATSATINPIACDSLVSPSGNYTWIVSGTYMDTIPNAVGCDSVITVNLTINNSTTATISPTACDSYVSPSTNFTWTTSGTYMDTITNALGCDSVITVNLTINNSTTATISPTACDSFVSPSTNYTWTVSGTYMDTIPNAVGCDSVITVNLTINNSTTATISPTACDSYVSPSTNYTWTTSGTYMDTITNALGCDSVITVNLTINNSSSATINPIACDSLVSPSGNYTWTVSGTYMDTIPNAAGCDSVITVNLTINNSTTATISPTACDSYVSPSTNYTWTTSGTYMDTITNAAGCDSVITVNLTINNSTTATITPTACDSYVSPSGNYTWTTSGSYLDTITNAVGCDSVITVNLTINNSTTATISPTACDSYVSPSTNFTWTVSGTYLDTIPNAVGCDSVITVNLTINYTTTATIAPVACDSFVSPSGTYTWTISGTYMDTIPNAAGCDSVITVNLTINNTTTATIAPTTCDSYVSPSGNFTWTVSGTYLDTITNALGCDSVITVNLTINNSTTATISPTACDSYVSPSTNFTWTVSGTYLDTIPNAIGCDSVITVNLTINNTTTATIAPTVCDFYISPSGNYTWSISGSYLDTLTNAAGCDSVITVNLTVNYSTASFITPVACDSFVSPSGNYTWTTSGSYLDTITNVAGCDSVIAINLTILNSTAITISPVACNSYVSPSGNYTWTTSGTYLDTLTNAMGCDSIITVNLTVNYRSNSTIAQVACDSYISPSGNYTWTVSGTYMDTIPNASGCDSIMTINLVVNYSSANTISPVVCDSYESPSGNYTWTTSGTYMDTLVNAVGCDSVITVNLTVNYTTFNTIAPVVCEGYISPGGKIFTVSGTYLDTITNASGCDSIMTINLTVNYNTNSTISPIACDSYLSPSGKYVWVASGSYLDTIPNAAGCDSIIAVNLIINSSTAVTINPVACDSYVSPSGNYTWTVSGTYLDTITNAMGCDEVITINLTVNYSSTGTISPVACDSYVSPSGNYTWTVSGSYLDTIPNAMGCDSVITVNLTINNTTTATIAPTACDSYVSPSGTYTWTTSGTYMDTLVNAVGCDSVITVNLTILNSTSNTIAPVTCDSYVSPSGTYTWTTSGTYMDTIPNAVGCDSVITVNLTILNSTSNTIAPVACDSYVSPSGKYTWTTSGMYMDTLVNAVGCDSVISVNLTINVTTTATIVPVVCYTYTSPSGNYTWTTSGTYMDTIMNAAGCDSVLTVNLTVNDRTFATINPVACDSYTSPSGNYTWTTSGSYLDTIPNAAGCDSVLTVNLTVNNSTTNTIMPVTCDSYTSPSGTYTWTASGTYMDTLVNAVGCDSVITVNLTILNSTSNTIAPVACDTYTSPSGKYNWTTSGSYMDTIPNAVGCDSVITVNLTINNTTSSTITPTSCFTYTSPSGNYTWTTSGMYMDTIPNAAGCDSIITIDLIIDTVNTVVTKSGNILTAHATGGGATYQWVDCDDGYSAVPGGNNQSFFTATKNGHYAVVVTQNGCTDTSACYAITTIGIEEGTTSLAIQLYPNPTKGMVTIVLDQGIEQATIRILNISGQTIREKSNLSGNRFTFDVADQADGLYFIELFNEGQVTRSKLIKR